MNEVGHTIVNAIIMALMTQGETIANLMAQLRAFSDWDDMMGFQMPVRAAVLTFVTIAFQYSGLPRKVFWAAPTLILPIVLPHRKILTFGGTIDVITKAITRAVYKLLATIGTDISFALTTTLNRTIYAAVNVRWGTLKNLTACNACHANFTRMRYPGTGLGTIPFLGIFIPIAVSLFRNRLAAHLAHFESLWMWLRRMTILSLMCTSQATKFASCIYFSSLVLIELNRPSAGLTVSNLHRRSIQGY